MESPPFATATDLADFLGVDFDATTTTQANRMLQAASDEIRSVIGQNITRTSSTAVLPGVEDYWLVLPQTPVVSVESVKMDGKDVTDFVLISGRLYRWWGWQDLFIIYEPRNITVTYTHGYATVPGDLVTLACSLASVAMAQTASGQMGQAPGLTGEGIDDYKQTFDGIGHGAMEIPKATAARLRAKYGNGQDMAVRA